MKDATADRWLPVQSVAEKLGCTDRFVYILVQQGELKAMNLGVRALRISEQSLQAFISSRIVDPETYFAIEEDAKESRTERAQVAKSKWINSR